MMIFTDFIRTSRLYQLNVVQRQQRAALILTRLRSQALMTLMSMRGFWAEKKHGNLCVTESGYRAAFNGLRLNIAVSVYGLGFAPFRVR